MVKLYWGKILRGVFCSLWAPALPLSAGVEYEKEIQHLLGYIKDSSCTFIRNGKAYDGKSASAHVLKKYKYLKNRIRHTDDFIRYAATESSISGKPYLVKCQGNEIPLADWLKAELTRHRTP